MINKKRVFLFIYFICLVTVKSDRQSYVIVCADNVFYFLFFYLIFIGHEIKYKDELF